MKIYMKQDEIDLFKKYLVKPNIKNYLEFGSGGSTYYASSLNNIKHITSYETDKKWLDKLKNEKIIKQRKSQIDFRFYNLECNWWEYVSWANENIKYMKNENVLKTWENYSGDIANIDIKPDLILIDGRFRISSCLESIKICHKNTIILFHDYTIRSQYHVIEVFLEKIDGINTLCIFKLRENIDLQELEKCIEKYRLIMD